MKRLRVSLLFIPMLLVLSSNTDKIYRIKLVEYNYEFFPTKRCNDTVYGHLNEGAFLKIALSGCKGQMMVEFFDSDSVMREKGAYVNSIELMKSYYYAIDAITRKKTIKVDTYYQPLRDGLWSFYNSKGVLDFTVFYNKGISSDTIFKQIKN